MTWSDPIVDEVRRVRHAYAARFNHDLRAIYRDLKEKEKRDGRNVVPCPTENEPIKSPESIGPTPTFSEKVST
ncbi:MAG TPA: hypothetical protein VE999_00150 [Gemmataceae bacterium]|nr:hypothetical protein [Gemmataceae bacterium]